MTLTVRKIQKVVSISVDVTNIKESADFIVNNAVNNNSLYVCVSNVHMCMEAFDSPIFSKVVNEADLIVPDGWPLSAAQKILGYKEASQVRGQDLMDYICCLSNDKDLTIGLYGGSSVEVLQKVQSNIIGNYPNVDIKYSYSPPFRSLTLSENEKVVADINNSGVGVLFVGIGCPKQEFWMAEHKGSLNCVMIGVGAAFDFISGEKKHAPKWVQKSGMEWLFRLCSEPKRLWKRYFKHNPRFIWYFVQQWLFGKKFN